MFEININGNSPRISLARAAQLTGYHQDYLGQLCRLGKLPATKVGRNWFTSAEALTALTPAAEDFVPDADPNYAPSAPAETIIETVSAVPEIEEIEELFEPTTPRPVIAQNITVSRVEDLPIVIESVPSRINNTNSVQNILTNVRIESLQKEVLELRQLLFKLMEEVKAHAGIIQSREIFSRAQDSLKHSYVSNFDFSIPQQRTVIVEELPGAEEARAAIFQPNFSRRYEVANWLATAVALIVLTFIGVGVISGDFLGSQPQSHSYYYQPQNRLQQTAQPEVAGVETAPATLPTDSTGVLDTNMIQ